MGRKHWENVKLLMRNFSFFQSVFKRLVLQAPKKQRFIWRRLRFTQMCKQRTTNTALPRSITTFMPLKNRRGMMASFYLKIIFSSTGHRPASLCHGLLSVVCPSVRPCVNFFFKHLLL